MVIRTKPIFSSFAKAAITASLVGLLAIGCAPPDQAEQRARALLERMTVEEKVGQIIQGDISSVTPEDARKYNLGSVLNGGNSAPGGGKTASWQQWVDAADAYWRASTDASDGGVAIPLLWGTDAVHGHNNLQMAVIFPHNSALGATRDKDLLRRIGAATAHEVKATGLDWAFAPTLAVAQDDRWGRAYESYSEDRKLVSELGASILHGLQGHPSDEAFLGDMHVIATAKHFVGDGGTQFGIDKGDTIGRIGDIKKIHAYPYRQAIKSNVQTVMASFSSVNGEKMHGSKELLTKVLRREMGFDGFVIGDWNGHAEIPGCTATDCPQALLAGVDMYMAPDSWKGLYQSLLAQVKDGTVPMARLDEAVLRILQVKIRAGLFEAGLPSARPGTDRAALGTLAHQEIGREAVRKSLVLLKNNRQTLPLNPQSDIVVIGKAARSMEQQTGGWTLSWQGDNNRNDEFEVGQTIYAGLKEAVEAAGGKINWVASADDISGKPDIAVYVFGEQPYAEFKGDLSDTVFEFENGPALAQLDKLQRKGIPVVSVFLTGRPLWVNPHINRSNAFVVGWLPGTQGGGIADVLIGAANGDAAHDFHGRLSFSWPSDGRGMPIGKADQSRVQFPLGYGLSYAKAAEDMAALSEKPGVKNASQSFDGILMAHGAAVAPLRFFLGDSSNWKTPANPFLTTSLGGTVSSRGVDYRAQEDARQLIWRGNGRATASLQTQRKLDLTIGNRASKQALVMHYRLDRKPTKPVTVSIACEDNCTAALDITQTLDKVQINQWQKLALPLRCFAQKGADMGNITTPFMLETQGALSLSLTHIELVADSENTCP